MWSQHHRWTWITFLILCSAKDKPVVVALELIIKLPEPWPIWAVAFSWKICYGIVGVTLKYDCGLTIVYRGTLTLTPQFMAPPTSPSGCDSCLRMTQKISELKGKISILDQIRDEEQILEHFGHRGPYCHKLIRWRTGLDCPMSGCHHFPGCWPLDPAGSVISSTPSQRVPWTVAGRDKHGGKLLCHCPPPQDLKLTSKFSSRINSRSRISPCSSVAATLFRTWSRIVTWCPHSLRLCLGCPSLRITTAPRNVAPFFVLATYNSLLALRPALQLRDLQ